MPATTSTFEPFMAENGEVGGRSAEHIGQDDHAVTAIDLMDRVHDVLAAAVHVVVGSMVMTPTCACGPTHVPWPPGIRWRVAHG